MYNPQLTYSTAFSAANSFHKDKKSFVYGECVPGMVEPPAGARILHACAHPFAHPCPMQGC